MDCRKGLWLVLGLAAGCQHQEMTLPPGAVPAGAVVKKATADAGKKVPKAETLVKYGDFKAREATAANYTDAQRQALVDEARKSYQEALKLDRKSVAAHLGLARLNAATDQYPKAVAAYQKAVDVAPKDASAWYALGLCHNHMQHWDKALTAVAKASQLDPENRTYANAQAVLLARAGRLKESLDCFGRVNGPAMANYMLGCTLRRLNQPELSRQCLETALQKNPQLAQAQAVLAEMTAEQAPAAQPAVRTVGYTEPQPVPQLQLPPNADGSPGNP
jgi:tetratricopeptide (TPR) repeat protein